MTDHRSHSIHRSAAVWQFSCIHFTQPCPSPLTVPSTAALGLSQPSYDNPLFEGLDTVEDDDSSANHSTPGPDSAQQQVASSASHLSAFSSSLSHHMNGGPSGLLTGDLTAPVLPQRLSTVASLQRAGTAHMSGSLDADGAGAGGMRRKKSGRMLVGYGKEMDEQSSAAEEVFAAAVAAESLAAMAAAATAKRNPVGGCLLILGRDRHKRDSGRHRRRNRNS